MPVGTCAHCRRTGRRLVGRGLCSACYQRENVRDLYDPTNPHHEPTEEELEQMIREQMENLPDWWPRDEGGWKKELEEEE